MIKLTKFKSQDHEFAGNAELIESIEETPDTVITLTTGKKMIVEEGLNEVMRKIIEFRREINRGSL